jgi:parallel beta-helix repeat protein
VAVEETKMTREVGRLALLSALPIGLVSGLPAQAASTLTKINKCPSVITAPGSYLVQKNLSCVVTAITINASNVDLDLGGHTLSGSGMGDGVYVEGQSNATIHDGSVQGFVNGIELQRTLNGKITNVTVSQNSNLGIVGGDTFGVTVTGCTATQNHVYGMWFGSEARANTITRNTANGNGYGGIALGGAFATSITNNTASDNGGVGIDVLTAIGNTVEGNTTDRNPLVGIQLYDHSNGNIVRGNSATGNGWGINMSIGSAHNTVQNNTVSGNSTGIEVGGSDGNASFNTIQGNSATMNTLGIWVEAGATSNTLQGNTALSNGGWDLGDLNFGCDSNLWSNNIFQTANQPCVAGLPLPPPPPPP